MARKWGRSQKYHVRPRTLYALLFKGGFCYIGQSVDVALREKQHRSVRGGWGGRQFECVILNTIDGTELDAVEYEYAWRLKAQRDGWKVYAKPPGITCNPKRQATPSRWHLAKSLRWPNEGERKPVWKSLLQLIGWILGASLLLALAGLYL